MIHLILRIMKCPKIYIRDEIFDTEYHCYNKNAKQTKQKTKICTLTCAVFVGQQRRKKIPSKLHLLLYKMFHLFPHSRRTNPTLGSYFRCSLAIRLQIKSVQKQKGPTFY
jgi:hypothetical protein